MDVTVPRVIAGWGVANGVLLSVLVAFGENGFAIGLYASVVAMLELVAIAAWWSGSRRPGYATFTPAMLPGRPALLVASAVPFIGLGFIYRPWMMLGAVYPVAPLAAAAVRRLFPDVADEPDPAAPAQEEPSTGHWVLPAAAVITVAAVVRRLRRRG